MKIASTILIGIGGALASVGFLQLSGLSLLGALGASVATAAQNPRRAVSWIPSAIIVAAIVTVILADAIGIGTHHQGT